MTVTLQMLRDVVVYEAKCVVARLAECNADHPLCLAVRALERHEKRVAELEARMAEEMKAATK